MVAGILKDNNLRQRLSFFVSQLGSYSYKISG